MKQSVSRCLCGWAVLIAVIAAVYGFAISTTKMVTMDTPEITKIHEDNGTVILEWSQVDFSTSYSVFRRAGAEEWTYLGSVVSTNYTDNAADGKTFQYSVRACNSAMGRLNLSGYAIPVECP